MSPFAQIPEFISCTRNLRFVILGIEVNWGCIMSFSGLIFITILILAYLIFLNRYEVKHIELSKTTKPIISSPQIQQLSKDDAKITDSGNLLPLLLNVQQQQQTLKADIDKVLVNITGLEQSVKDIGASTQNLDRVITGAQSKGALGEQIIERNLSQLPNDWIRRNVPFRNDTRVEFCVCSPDGRLIPIDSKWAGTRLLDQIGQTSDKAERGKLETALKNEVWKRGLEVTKYLDDDRTIGFVIATVPDAVFDICLELQPYLVKRNIVLISYSLLVPYILILVKLFLSNAQGIQAMQISHILSSSIIEIEQIQEFIDTKLRRPLDTFKLQQTESHSQSERLEEVYQKLRRIQNDLEVMRISSPVGNNSLSNSEISSIPDELKHRVSELRNNLIESKSKQNQHIPNNSSQKPVE